jgi:hypothetical protein
MTRRSKPVGWVDAEWEGRRIGLWTTSSEVVLKGRNWSVWCVCTCGRKQAVDLYTLEHARTFGCVWCRGSNLAYGYGEKERRIAKRYDAIVHRCSSSKNPKYHRYGGRGIKLLFRDRLHFVQYVMKELPHESYVGIEIDRKDNNGHYEPGNIRLATRGQNGRNKENTILVSYQGERMPALDFAEKFSPYGPEHTRRLARMGFTGEEIMSRRELPRAQRAL